MLRVTLPEVVFVYNEEMVETVEELTSEPIEVRAEREERLRQSSDWDERTPAEKMLDRIVATRITYYKPNHPPSRRRDIICMCCGQLYRPDDVMDAENVLLCATCILIRKEG